MRAYMIDEIASDDIEKIRSFLGNNSISSNLEGIFWIRIPSDILTEIQLEHQNCQPHITAAEVGRDWLKLEFFVRSLTNMNCACAGYCNPEQKEFIINFAEAMIEQLAITT